jgi:hypothetical protein
MGWRILVFYPWEFIEAFLEKSWPNTSSWIVSKVDKFLFYFFETL